MILMMMYSSDVVTCGNTRNFFSLTLSLSKSVALLQSLSSRILVTRGNRTEMPAAVWAVDLLNSAPVISQTGDAYMYEFMFFLMPILSWLGIV